MQQMCMCRELITFVILVEYEYLLLLFLVCKGSSLSDDDGAKFSNFYNTMMAIMMIVITRRGLKRRTENLTNVRRRMLDVATRIDFVSVCNC